MQLLTLHMAFDGPDKDTLYISIILVECTYGTHVLLKAIKYVFYIHRIYIITLNLYSINTKPHNFIQRETWCMHLILGN